MKRANDKVLAHTKRIVLIALCAALMWGGKLALSFIPNVEVVTLFIVVFTFSFGLIVSFPATVVFCTLEWLLYGFGYWVISYYLYFPLLAVIVYFVGRIKRQSLRYFVTVACTFAATVLFGVLTTLVDALIFSNLKYELFVTLFSAYYIRGIAFFATHVVSNTLIVAVCHIPLTRLCERLNSGNGLPR